MTGWIYKREFIECGIYSHLTYMKNNLEKFPDEIQEIYDSIQRIYDECADAAASGEHPEWHNCDMAETDANFEARQLLTKLGFIRVGSTGTDVYFEGSANSLKDNMQFCKDLTTGANLNPFFETVVAK